MVFHILLALVDQDRHGYAIIKAVREHTDGEVTLGTGSLYAALRRLLEARLIVEVERRPTDEREDERRRYYRITTLGLQVATEETRRLSRMAGLAERLLALPGSLESEPSR